MNISSQLFRGFVRKFALLLILTAINVSAQENVLTSWHAISETAIPAGTGTRYIVPQHYRTVAISMETLREFLAAAPLEGTVTGKSNARVISLPMPDGTSAEYAVQESPVMAPALAAQFPELKTYSVAGLTPEAGNGRIDCTPLGFHAILFTLEGTVYIDPYAMGDAAHYISYYTRDYINPAKRHAHENCVVDEHGSAREEIEYLLQGKMPLADVSKRTYRLALACTGEYAAYYGGTVTGAMNGIVTSINRVNAVYMRDLAIKMELVANNSSIVYTNASTDPFTNTNGSTMLSQNQTTCDNIIGTANYDIGHVFSTGGGGIAGLGVVCRAGNKARGVTGGPAPVGDPFDIDYVAHEMGHQYGANHTFNSQTGSCGGGNRVASVAYEPGSGTTIMAYAGICGSDDLQPNSDDHFHLASLNEIIAYTRSGSGSTCPVTTLTANSNPSVTAPTGGFTIPFKTPFSLTANATDPENDAVTYCWEQYDLGPAGTANAPSGNAPIFRSFKPTASPTRLFPKLTNLLNNTQTIGELLPTYARSLAFRVTARDNNSAGGGIAYAAISFAVTDQAGPFLVTSPNTNVSWEGNSSREVTWNVANTNNAPVNCALVNIKLSTDGGQTFPTVLAANTANDGTEFVMIPNTATSTARIKVEAVGNIFFDLSNTNFTITLGGGNLTINSPLLEGWNMVSVPVNVADMSAASLFSQANSAVYGYNNGYVTSSTLSTGKGYWVRYPSAQTVSFTGASTGTSSVNLAEGWNMIGAYQNSAPVSSITTTPAGIINSNFYGFNNGYFVASSLTSAQGYWVRATQAGVMNLGVLEKGSPRQTTYNSNLGKLIITDATGKTQTLYLSENSAPGAEFDLPPVPPAGMFDVRFSSQKSAAPASSLNTVVISGAEYPLTLRSEGSNITIRDNATNGKIFSSPLSAGSEMTLVNSGVNTLNISSENAVASFELMQNYPNPFNPSTSITFALPEKANVSLNVFNQLGEKIAELARGEFESGYHSVEWNASGVPSGIYFYIITTGKFSATKKLVILK